MKVQTKQAFVFPNPVALVTVADEAGHSNIITIAWAGMACSDPVHVTIAVRPSRHSYDLLAQSGQFVMNIPGQDLLAQTDHCGVASGRDEDKWETTGLTPVPALHVGAAIIDECPYALECEVVETVALGAHDLFIGRVLAAHVDESMLDDDGTIHYERMQPIAYLPYDYFAVGENVYHYGESART